MNNSTLTARLWGRLQTAVAETLKDVTLELVWPFIVQYHPVFIALAAALAITPYVYQWVARVWNYLLTLVGWTVVASLVGGIVFLVVCAISPGGACPAWLTPVSV